MDYQSCHLSRLGPHIEMSLADPDIDAKGMHKDGRMVPSVIDVEQGDMNLTSRMACNILYADHEVSIQFYADAVLQLCSTKWSAWTQPHLQVRTSYSTSSRLSMIVSLHTSICWLNRNWLTGLIAVACGCYSPSDEQALHGQDVESLPDSLPAQNLAARAGLLQAAHSVTILREDDVQVQLP